LRLGQAGPRSQVPKRHVPTIGNISSVVKRNFL
jgi:hypothetical protein